MRHLAWILAAALALAACATPESLRERDEARRELADARELLSRRELELAAARAGGPAAEQERRLLEEEVARLSAIVKAAGEAVAKAEERVEGERAAGWRSTGKFLGYLLGGGGGAAAALFGGPAAIGALGSASSLTALVGAFLKRGGKSPERPENA